MASRKVSLLIIQNQKEDILLMLRDNKETIPFPNYWSFIGGSVEKNEAVEKALIREVQEELDYNLENYKFFKKHIWNDIEFNIFYIHGDYQLSDFKLGEGQEIKFFTREEISTLKIVPIHKEMLCDYLKTLLSVD